MQLREYQTKCLENIYKSWEKNRNTLAVLPTGSGKTVIFCEILAKHIGHACVIAHRQELVSQIALALARRECYHNIIAPESVVRECISAQIDELGCHYFDADSRLKVAGVDTLTRRDYDWYAQVTLWVLDEAHHIQADNKWGKAVSKFVQARGLGVTATPARADGKALDGVFDELIVGASMRELIDTKYLCDYSVYAPENKLDLTRVKIGANGDYSLPTLINEVQKASITGDIVTHYTRYAAGKRGITFAVDVIRAKEIRDAYRQSGISAELVTAKTPGCERSDIMRRFRIGEVMQLVNVDIFAEGTDVPEVGCVTMARPTMSFPLFSQQVGRALRIAEGKTEAIILDHVGNFLKHGFPESRCDWTLAGKRRNKKKPTVFVSICVKCSSVFERRFRTCPYCNHSKYEDGATYRDIDFICGDLELLDHKLKWEKQKEYEFSQWSYDEAREYYSQFNHSAPIVGSLVNRHYDRKIAIDELSEAVTRWIASRSEREFYLEFGVDALTAKTLKAKEAKKLEQRIRRSECASNSST